MSHDNLKQLAAERALDYIGFDEIIGVGTGSTVNFFIDALAPIKGKIKAAVSSSNETTSRLKALNIPIEDLNAVRDISVYIDGADEVNPQKQLIKGGGGALTREKIIAAVAKKFVCIVDESKKVDILGGFPLPIEVIPIARGYVAREMVKLGGAPEYREGFVTDNGNVILDIYNLNIVDPASLEKTLNQIVGVVTSGIFANRVADTLICAGASGVSVQ